MKISLIIPVINEAALLVQSIDRAWAAGADEVIIADGGSQDGTLELARTSRCHLVRCDPGRGRQLNAGVQAATGEVLLFLHADNWLVANGCQQIREGLTQTDRQFGGFHQRIDHPTRMFRWIESGNAWRIKWRGLIYGDQAFFIRRPLFESLGGFPEIALMEDLELSRRLKAIGKPLILEGPTHVGARRWQSRGPVRQTLTNWMLSTAYLMGADPAWLEQKYRRHDHLPVPSSSDASATTG